MLLVDYPALLRAVRHVHEDAAPQLGAVVARSKALGPLLVARAYGAWYDTEEATDAFRDGLDPVFVPPTGPASVPTSARLIADGMGLLRTGAPEVLALSGDDRLYPLVVAAREAGVRVALIAHSCQPDGPTLPLAEVAEPVSAFARVRTRAEKYRRAAERSA